MTRHGAVAVFLCEDTDEVLVERVRQGDDTAFEELYRRHTRVAVAVARRILRSPQDSEDAAADAFTNVLSALRREVGPREMFRPYLMTCVRNTCLLRLRQQSQQACTRERANIVDINVSDDEKIVEGAVAAAALHAIPERAQRALWMAEVEQLEPVTIAQRLGIDVPAAGALVYRARQRFTEAYLAQHVRRSGRPACAALSPKLAQYVRGTAGTIAIRQVESHIDECASCAAALAELSDVNASLRSIPAPLSLATAAGTTVAASGGMSGVTATIATGIGAGRFVKAAALAALSLAPLVAGGDAASPLNTQGSSSSSAGVTGSGRVLSTQAPGRIVDQAGNTGDEPRRTLPIEPSNPSSDVGPGAGPVNPSVIDPGGAVVELPAVDEVLAVLPAVEAETPEVVEPASTLDRATTGLVTVLSTLPALPAIELPAIELPAITFPALPSIVIPSIPPLPSLTIPAVRALPTVPIPTVPIPTVIISVPEPSLPTVVTVPSIVLTPAIGVTNLLGGAGHS